MNVCVESLAYLLGSEYVVIHFQEVEVALFAKYFIATFAQLAKVKIHAGEFMFIHDYVLLFVICN